MRAVFLSIQALLAQSLLTTPKVLRLRFCKALHKKAMLASGLFILSIGCTSLYAVDYRIEDGWISLDDGVRLSVTYYIPQTDSVNTRYPVLLEMLPYRKEDLSKAWAHPHYDYFASQGIALAKVDMRGTGSSEGALPTREYSAQEIDDAVEVIAKLADQPWSNGNVGMWGISWGGFNSIQVAMRNPPQLKAILAAHASDDLYRNDINYTDGLFGIDEYILSINHMNGFMQSPGYEIDESYFENRFDREPWLFEMMRNSIDNEFWRGGSLRWHYQDLKIPVYLIGGLLDGYRDTLPHVLENSNVPVRAILGPWPHAWPDSASPGPTWEWREDASRWWKHWLGEPSAKDPEFESNSFRFYQRSGNTADASLSALNGRWFQTQWPLPSDQTMAMEFYPSRGNTLQANSNNFTATEASLNRVTSTGIELGEWWGELLPDMSAIDNESLVFDSKAFENPLAVLGEARVNLLAASDTADGHWIVRLEDVAPDGSATLITGGAVNGQIQSPIEQPKAMVPGEFYQLNIPLRMTTWTFQPGHRLRLAISNSAFPMFWPSPGLSASRLKIDSAATKLELPVWTAIENAQELAMASGETSNYLSSDIISIGPLVGSPRRSETIINEEDGTVNFIRESGLTYEIEEATIETTRHTNHQANLRNPALSQYTAWAEYAVQKSGIDDERIVHRTEISVKSDETNFYLDVSRILMSGDEEIRRKRWQESILRKSH